MREIFSRQFFRGSLLYFFIFSSLFILHIVFAANDFEILFRAVAIIITIITFIVGPMVIILGNISSSRVTVNRFSGIISIFLSIALGWAYSEMSWKLQIIYWPLVAIICHLIAERYWLTKHDFK